MLLRSELFLSNEKAPPWQSKMSLSLCWSHQGRFDHGHHYTILDLTLALAVITGPVGHHLAQSAVQEARAQPWLRDVIRLNVAHHQRVCPGGVPDAATLEQHRAAERSRRSLGGPVGQPFRPQVVHRQPGLSCHRE